jgi:threonine dehydrogenase-like Zn-dependent dehydrogenase
MLHLMQAITLHDGKPGLREVDAPTPPAGEVLIRPTRLGVCATDLELCRGYMGFDGVLGHEFVGMVERVADAGDRSLIGQRVVGNINCVCGRCDMCQAGLPSHCRDRTVLGIAGRDGCFAERFCLPTANLVPVPDHVDDDNAVFAEPLAAALQVARQLTIEGRPYITVLGDGRLGLLCVQVMARLNATVRLVGKHPEKLGLCEKWGIKARPLDEVGLRQDQDVVIDCTGSASGLTTAMQMVRPRGTIVLKTTVAPPGSDPARPPVDLSPIVVHEIQLVGSRCGPMGEAVALLASGGVDVVSLISKRMRLSDGVATLQAAARPGMIKVVIDP